MQFRCSPLIQNATSLIVETNELKLICILSTYKTFEGIIHAKGQSIQTLVLLRTERDHKVICSSKNRTATSEQQ